MFTLCYHKCGCDTWSVTLKNVCRLGLATLATGNVSGLVM